MIGRPKPGETEDDLLRQQEKFFKCVINKRAATYSESIDSINNKDNNQTTADCEPGKSSQIFGIIGDIIEKKPLEYRNTFCDTLITEGFPPVVTLLENEGTKVKKNLFALKMEGSLEKSDANIDLGNQCDEQVGVGEEDAIKAEIHEENMRKLEAMSQQEIIDKRKNLEAVLQPDVLEFLKARGAKKISKRGGDVYTGRENSEGCENEAKEKLLKYLDKEWIKMSKIEPEKLEWIGDIPDSSTLRSDGSYQARFDFTGMLQPFTEANLDVRTSLYHHGSEPNRPGYTIQELFALSRSNLKQMRMLGLTTLAMIISKAKLGYYDSCFDGSLLKTLIEGDVFLLIRFSLDDRVVYPTAILCLYHLVCCPSDETALDLLDNYFTDGSREPVPVFMIDLEMDKDTKEEELKDEEIINQDLIRGLLRTNVLIRLKYILTHFQPEPPVVEKIFQVFLRIARHSSDAALQLFHNLFSVIIDKASQLPAALKLLRIILIVVGSSSTSIRPIIIKQDFTFLLFNLDVDEDVNLTKQDLYRLKLESMTLISVLVAQNIFLEEIQSYFPNLIRMMWFFAHKVDAQGARFDFELYASIITVLLLLSKVMPLPDEFEKIVSICVKKWVAQGTVTSPNMSLCKALGASFGFLKKFNLQKEIHAILSNPIFHVNLINKSHLLNYVQPLRRDPPNLPSLGSVYFNGENYLSIIHEESCFPLFFGILEHEIIDFNNKQSYQIHFARYVEKIFQNNAPMIPSWFNRYETHLLVRLFEIFDFELVKVFKLFTYLRKDDPDVLRLLKILFKRFPQFDQVFFHYENYLAANFSQFSPQFAEHVANDWPYHILANNPQALKFVAHLVKHEQPCTDTISVSQKYFQLCQLYLKEDDIFCDRFLTDVDIILDDVFCHLKKIDLDKVQNFYEFFMELLTHYAAVSYSDSRFGKLIAIPLSNRFDISYRKLVWSEYLHVVQVLTLAENSFPIEYFVNPEMVEIDTSLLMIYVNAVLRKVVTAKKNPFIFKLLVENIRIYLIMSRDKNLSLTNCLIEKINTFHDDLKNYILHTEVKR